MQLLSILDPATIDWSRAQFALTACYHWLFVPLTLGLALIMGIMETLYYVKGDEFWKRTAQFWMKLFGINFAVGVATGLILEFEFGTNWSNYSWFVGDIFGAPLAIEGILAFFMEATFIAVMFFGWQKVSRGFHLASTWLTGIGATMVDSGGQRLDAAPRRHGVQPRDRAQRNGRFHGRSLFAHSRSQVLPYRVERLDDRSRICGRRKLLVPAQKTQSAHGPCLD